MSAMMERYRGTVCRCGADKQPNTLVCGPCQVKHYEEKFLQDVQTAPCPACYFQHGGQHIGLTCKNHRDRVYSMKNIHCRTLHYLSHEPECDCSGHDIIHICPNSGKEFSI